MNRLLELRKEIKERKPEFIRQDNPKRMKVNDKWRKPKGIHSKIRHKFKGRRKMPSSGYKSPFDVRGLHMSGMKMVNLSSVNELDKIDKNKEGIIVGKTVGKKKKLEIWKKAKEMDIKVLNLNADEHIAKIEQSVRAKSSSKKKSEKKETKKKSKEHNEKKSDGQKDMTEEERKDAEKKEKDRILTKKV